MRWRVLVGGAHLAPQAHACTRVETRTRGEFHTHQIGFGFVLAAEFEREQLGTVVGDGLPELPQVEQLADHADADIGGSVLADALACVLAQRVGDFVAHHHGHFVVGELQGFQDAGVESDLAARHAIRVDLVGAQQVDLPAPIAGARVPVECKRNDAAGNRAQAFELGIVLGCQRALFCCLTEHHRVLLRRRALQLLGRHKLGKRRGATHLHALAALAGVDNSRPADDQRQPDYLRRANNRPTQMRFHKVHAAIIPA